MIRAFVATALHSLPAGRRSPTLASTHWSHWTQKRNISEEQLSADGAQLEELFEQNMSKASRKRSDAPRLLTTRRESLHLYREIMRYSNLFVWKDDKGVVWRDVLRANARKEYETARFEDDPEIINKLIITGRDAVNKVVESFWKRRNRIIQEEAALQDSRELSPGGSGSGPGFDSNGRRQ